jgi:hypothetical protein
MAVCKPGQIRWLRIMRHTPALAGRKNGFLSLVLVRILFPCFRAYQLPASGLDPASQYALSGENFPLCRCSYGCDILGKQL